MASEQIPVDVANPGQVFACLGLQELAVNLMGAGMAGFVERDAMAFFALDVPGEAMPISTLIHSLLKARLTALYPASRPDLIEKWSDKFPALEAVEGDCFPIAPPDSHATLPARLRLTLDDKTHQLDISHWGDATRCDNAKFWAGAGGYPGAALLRDALERANAAIAPGDNAALEQPFDLSAPQSSSVRLDPRSSYIPMDTGFSLNRLKKGSIQIIGYPLVDLLATIGLSHARPCRGKSKVHYRYAILCSADTAALYDVRLMRTALGGGLPAMPQRRFTMQLDWPGKEGQARCISNVQEDE